MPVEVEVEDEVFFLSFVNFSSFYWNFMGLKSSVLANSASAFVILAGLRSSGVKYLTMDHLKHQYFKY